MTEAGSMLDHIALSVSDYERSRRFYQSALAPLGYELIMDHDISGSGFGRDGKPDFWIQFRRSCMCTYGTPISATSEQSPAGPPSSRSHATFPTAIAAR